MSVVVEDCLSLGISDGYPVSTSDSYYQRHLFRRR
jgi:hypothetical protein